MKSNELGKVIAISGMDAGRTNDMFAIMVKNEFAKMVAAQTNLKFKELGQKELARMEKFMEEHREPIEPPIPMVNGEAQAMKPAEGNTPDPKAK